MWFAPPSWNPAGGPPPTDAELRARAKYGPEVATPLKAYATAQFAPVIAAIFFMLLWQYTAPRGPLLVGAALVSATLLTVGALMDRRRWAVPLELARLAALGATVVAWRPLDLPLFAVIPAAVVFAGGSALALLFAARYAGGADSSAEARAFEGRAPAAGGACSSP
jgi:hypothetical protein